MLIKDLDIKITEKKVTIDGYVVIKRDESHYILWVAMVHDVPPEFDTSESFAKEANEVVTQFLDYCKQVDNEWIIDENELPDLPKRSRVITARKIEL